MIRRLFVLALVSLVLVLSACTNPRKRPSMTPVSQQPDMETIHLYVPLDERPIDEVIAAFQQQYPRYRVEKAAQNPTDESQLSAMMMNGSLDVVTLPGMSEQSAKSSQALDVYIHRDGFDLKPFGTLVEKGLVNGHYYGLPFLGYPWAMFASVNLLSAAGVTLPEQSWTWDDFRTVAKKVTHTGGDSPVFSVDQWDIEDLVQVYLEQEADRPAWLATDAELKDALAYFRSLVALDHSVPPVQVREWEDEYADSRYHEQRMKESPAARFVFHTGFLVTGTDAPGAITLPIPNHAGLPFAAPVMADWMAIAGGTRHPDAAWAFIRFATGRDGAVVVAKSGGVPLRADEGIEEAWFADPQRQPTTKALFHTRWYIRPETLGGPDGNAKVRNRLRLNRLINRTLAQGMDVDTALAQFHKEMEGSVLGR